ncbi:MAG TPA: hypothetical protein VMZ06_14780 [Candidatus Bathyarchaeia archaeon]|nr:hypothetical protein [Candidatus Bathyarchaeia archaeon]
MKHVRPLTRVAAVAPISPLQAKYDYIAGLLDAAIAFVMQKEGGAL